MKKNKVAPPFKIAEFDIMYDEGVSTVGDLLDLGVEYGIIDKRGSYYRYDDDLIGQGREMSKHSLRENAALADIIDALVRERAGLPARQTPFAAPDSDGADASIYA